MAYGDFKDLAGRTASDKVLRDKLFNIAKNLKYDGYLEVLLLWFIIFWDKKPQVVVLSVPLNKISKCPKNLVNQLLENLKNVKYNRHLKRIFGVLILQICN